MSFSGLPPAVKSGFELRVIDSKIGDPWLKTLGDLDGDGRLDLVAGGAKDGGLVAYLNRFPGWDRLAIDGAGRFSTDGEVADIDGDGRNDLVVITRGPDTLSWYRNVGANWVASVLARRTLHDIEVADFDGDGLPDIVGRNQKEWPSKDDAGNRLYFLWRRGGAGVAWEETEVECPAGEGLLAVDLDRDGDKDIVINGRWLENLGGRKWTERPFTPAGEAGWTHPNTYIASADINGDGRTDIVLAPSERKGGRSRICWFEGPKDPRGGEWRMHVVVPDVETVCHFVGSADFNGDGRADLVYAQMPQGDDPDSVRVLLNRGESKGGKWLDRWSPLTISEEGSHSMRIGDFDGDGRPDLFGANWNAEGRDEDVKLWLNRLKAERR